MPLLSRWELDVIEEERVKGQKQGMVMLRVFQLEQRLGKVTQKARGQLIKLTTEQLQELGGQNSELFEQSRIDRLAATA